MCVLSYSNVVVGGILQLQCVVFCTFILRKKTPKICQLYWHFFVSDVVYVSYDADLLFT